jgi:hypothetical protein
MCLILAPLALGQQETSAVQPMTRPVFCSAGFETNKLEPLLSNRRLYIEQACQAADPRAAFFDVFAVRLPLCTLCTPPNVSVLMHVK